jgi:hypothetical protein
MVQIKYIIGTQENLVMKDVPADTILPPNHPNFFITKKREKVANKSVLPLITDLDITGILY